MHSGVFAISPEAAAELTLGFCPRRAEGQRYRDRGCRRRALPLGVLQTRLYAIAKLPTNLSWCRIERGSIGSSSEEEFKDQIALFAGEVHEGRLSLYHGRGNHYGAG